MTQSSSPKIKHMKDTYSSAQLMLALFLGFILISSPAEARKGRSVARGLASDQIESLQSQLKENPENVEIREKLAQSYYNKKQWSQVVELLNAYTEQISPSALFWLAGSFNSQEDYKNEVRILKFIYDRDKKNYKLLFILGHAHLSNEQEEEAVESFRRAIKLKKKYKPAYDSLLNIFIKNDNRYEARVVLNDMIQLFGDRPAFYNDLCRLYALDGFIKQAETSCMKGIRLSPGYPDNYVYLGQTYKFVDQKDKAARVLVTAAKKFKDSELAQYATGLYYFDQKNFPVAQRYFARAVKAEKTKRSFLGLAKAAFENESWELSYTSFNASCKQDSSVSGEFLSAGAKLRQQGQERWAQKFTRTAYGCKQ